MAKTAENRAQATQLLRAKFPTAEVGLNNNRPYARMPDGTLYGVLFGTMRQPIAIIRFGGGVISARNWDAVEWIPVAPEEKPTA